MMIKVCFKRFDVFLKLSLNAFYASDDILALDAETQSGVATDAASARGLFGLLLLAM